VSEAALAGSLSSDSSPTAEDDQVGIEVDSCVICGHPEGAHQLLLTPTVAYVICHESTEDGECYRVRHSRGIPFGACRRDPP
jgi:hypothetical protein